MKHVALLGLGLIMLGSIGCSTKGYVREQIDPVSQRLDKLESCVRDMNRRLGDIEKTSGTTAAGLDAARKEIADTRGQLQQGSTGQQNPAAAAEAAATRAEEAATRAETAAGKAERSADKSSKAFELGQRK